MTATRKRRRVLVLSPFAPRHDSAYGAARLIAEQLEALSAQHDLALLCLRAAGDPPTDDRVRGSCDVVEEVVRSVTRDRAARHVRPLRALVQGVPLWVANWTEPAFAQRLRALVQGWGPEIVQLEFHVMGQYLPAIVEHHGRCVLVEHEPGHPAALERWRSARGLVRWMRAIDARAWKRFERTLLARVDAVVAFTDADVRRLAELSHRSPVVIRPGIHIPPRPLDPRGRPPLDIVFVGNFTHPPNLDAALRLVRSIHPRLRARLPELQLHIVGDHAPPELCALAGEHVRVTGRVPDLVPFLDRAAVVVAPLRRGGGIRVKMLETLAAGKAVVASPLACEGLGVTAGEHCLVADTDDEIVTATATLLEDPALRARLAGAARAWAVANLGWTRAVAAYGDLYDRLLDEPARGEAAEARGERAAPAGPRRASV